MKKWMRLTTEDVLFTVYCHIIHVEWTKVVFSKNKNKRGVALKQRSAVILGVHYETYK